MNARRPESFPDQCLVWVEECLTQVFLTMNCLYNKTVSERGEGSSVSRNILGGRGWRGEAAKKAVPLLSVPCPSYLLTKSHSLCICTKEVCLTTTPPLIFVGVL